MTITPTKTALVVLISFLLAWPSWAQAKKKITINSPTHISAGWVALSDGTLYKCAIKNAPEESVKCQQAKGLPTVNRIEQLWGEQEYAWVILSNGYVYGCHARFKSLKKREAPSCVFAEGIF